MFMCFDVHLAAQSTGRKTICRMQELFYGGVLRFDGRIDHIMYMRGWAGCVSCRVF